MAENAAGISKMEAVRRVLSDLGNDAYPVAIQTQLMEKYGISMSTLHFNYRPQMCGSTREGPRPAAAKSRRPEPAARARRQAVERQGAESVST